MNSTHSIFNLSLYNFSWYAMPLYIVGLLAFILGILVFQKNRKSTANVAFFVMCCCVFIWLFGYGLAYSTIEREIAHLYHVHIVTFGIIFIPASVYFFTTSILDILGKKRGFVAFNFILSLCFYLYAVLSGTFISGTYEYFWGYYPTYGASSYPFILYFFFIMFESLRLYFIHFKKTSSLTKRKQIKILFIAFGTAYLGSFDYLPSYGIEVYPFGYIPILIFLLTIGYATLKYNLFEFNIQTTGDTILSTIADMIIVTDMNLQIEFVNQSTLSFLGYKKEELYEQSLMKVYKGKENGEVFKMLQENKEDSVRNIDVDFLTKGGQSISVNISASVIEDEEDDKTSVGIVIVAKDIRKNKKLVKELEEKTLSLEKTQDKLNEQLEEMEKFNKLMVNREVKMVELKEEIKKMKEGKNLN